MAFFCALGASKRACGICCDVETVSSAGERWEEVGEAEPTGAAVMDS
jgi:hypothetical protein